MSTRYRVAEHEVTAIPIAEVLPLVIHERIQPPQTGVVLVLEDGKKLNWIPEGGRIPTAAEDLMVRDEMLGVSFTVTPQQFAETFTEVEETDHVRRA